MKRPPTKSRSGSLVARASLVLLSTGSLLVLGAPGPVPAGALSRTTAALTCANVRVVRPSRYELGCGSGTYVLTDLHWRAWGDERATASGLYVVNNCVPTCAAGHDSTFRATITLGAVATTSHGRLFRRLWIAYSVRGHAKRTAWSLPPFG